MDFPELAGLPKLNDTATGARGFENLTAQDFMKILLAELRSQDPLEPFDNGQLLQQINAMNTLTGTHKLVEAIESMSLTQSLGSAGNLIGRSVTGSPESGDALSGVVEKAVVENGQVFLVINGTRVPIGNVTEIS